MSLEGDGEELDYKDEGFIELVLKILGLMCDGQNQTLQVGSCVTDRTKHYKWAHVELNTTHRFIYQDVCYQNQPTDLCLKLGMTLLDFSSTKLPVLCFRFLGLSKDNSTLETTQH